MVVEAAPKTKHVVKEVNDKVAQNIQYQHDKDREPVKGIFKYYEVPGGCLEFNYRAYKQDPIEFFSLRDGEVYTLPLGIAKHLNKSGWYPEYEYYKSDQNTTRAFSPEGHVMRVASKVRRYGFQSLEFVDIDDISEVGKGISEVSIV
jgi:hypothetical protein